MCIAFLSVVSIQATGQSGDAAAGFLFLILVVGLGILLYFLPSIVGRDQRNFAGIFILNLLLGWTLVGWVVALVWAVTKETQSTQVVVNRPTLPSPVLCSSCGKYSQAGSKFCSSCGAALSVA